MKNYIEINRLGEICFLHMNKPGTNSLDQFFLDELYEKINLITDYNKVKVIILSSKLRFGFSSGMDLRSFSGTRQEFIPKMYNAVLTSFKIIRLMLTSSKIFICALSGPVIGSAASIAFGCDFRIAAEDTWLWLPDVKYGGLLADGGIELIAKYAGNSRALILALSNERLASDEAVKWGLFYKTVKRCTLDDTVRSLAKRLCGFSFKSLSMHKRMVNKNILDNFNEALLKEMLSSEETYETYKFYMKI